MLQGVNGLRCRSYPESVSADDVVDLLENDKKQKSTKKAVKTSAKSTSTATGNDNEENSESSSCTAKPNETDPQPCDSRLLAQICEDENAADIEPDDGES